MNELFRALAPISAAGWSEIEDNATKTLKVVMGGRKVVDFTGPLGWTVSAINIGRAKKVEAPRKGVEARLREVQPLVEIRVPFTLQRSELEAAARGAKDAEMQPVIDAARTLALSEDTAIFNGFAAAGITGIAEAGKDRKLTLSADYLNYPATVSQALSKLRNAGVDGPYALVLGPRCYGGLLETTTPAGYPVMEHVKKLIDGPIVFAPAVNGAVVVSMRGGDFELTVGQDPSIGYLEHNATEVKLFLQESFTFRVLSPEAAVPMAYD